MSVIIRLYTMLTAISRWIEAMRIYLLVRAYGINNECPPLVPWRKREGLPSHDQWPKIRLNGELRIEHPIWVRGKVKVGPVHPVPAKFDKENS